MNEELAYSIHLGSDKNKTAEEIIDIVKSTPKENYDKHIDFFGQWPNETRKIKK